MSSAVFNWETRVATRSTILQLGNARRDVFFLISLQLGSARRDALVLIIVSGKCVLRRVFLRHSQLGNARRDALVVATRPSSLAFKWETRATTCFVFLFFDILQLELRFASRFSLLVFG